MTEQPEPAAPERPAREAAEAVPAKRVSWAELFFDLVFVFAITQMSALLHADHSLAGVGRALVVFVPVYWMWVGMSVHANTRDVENPLDRIGIFAVALGSLVLALTVPQALGGRAVLSPRPIWPPGSCCWPWCCAPGGCSSTRTPSRCSWLGETVIGSWPSWPSGHRRRPRPTWTG